MVVPALPSSRVRSILNGQEFARLPASARNVKIQGWAMGFAYETWLRFDATHEDVETFLSRSPALQGLEPERLGPDKMLIRRPEDYRAEQGKHDSPPHVFLPEHRLLPDWWEPEIREKGRRYDNIPLERLGRVGAVIVNDRTGTVYIWLGD